MTTEVIRYVMADLKKLYRDGKVSAEQVKATYECLQTVRREGT